LFASAAKDMILVVDDEPLISDIIAKCLEAEGYTCDISHSAEDALGKLELGTFSLVVSDIMMPGKTGIELLTIIKEQYPDMAVIMVTAVDDRKTAVKALQLGAYGFVIKPFDLNEIAISVVNALERRRLHMQSRQYEARLENDVRARTVDVHRREEEICMRLTSACEYRDSETGSHTRRLGMYCYMMGGELGWDERLRDEIRIAACMHDIGKIGVPDVILLKQGLLTASEFEIIKTHTTIGAQILSGSDISLLNMARDIALSHHEKWNGTGYPQGVAGQQIPESARMVAILDVYDALVHERVYRQAMSEEDALDIMAKDRGAHFDPRIFDAFFHIIPEIRKFRLAMQDRPQ